MKKLVLSFAILLALVLSASAQNPEKLIRKLSAEKNVVNISVGGFLLGMVKPVIASYAKETIPLINGIKKIELVTAENSDSSKIADYSTMIRNLKDIGGYETLVEVKDESDFVRIMIKATDEKIKDLYIFCCDNTDIAAIRMHGNIKHKDIQKMINKYSKKD